MLALPGRMGAAAGVTLAGCATAHAASGQHAQSGKADEKEEHELLGEHGFENTVSEVAKLEAAFDIADLAKFTIA